MNWLSCRTSAFSQEEYDRTYGQLTPSRKAHIDRFRLPADKTRSLAAELLVQKLLAQAYELADVQLDRKENGQPALLGCDLFVSIAHCEDIVVCAVSETSVGIDVERIRPIDLTAARHVCVEEELVYLLDGAPLPEGRVLCREPETLQRFYEIWTAKEAYFKKCGTGITNLKAINILPLERQIFRQEDYLIQII